MAFNAQQYAKKADSASNLIFTCSTCGTPANFHVASKGCPCGENIFKVATRGTGYPSMWDRDKGDPYMRQKQKPWAGDDKGMGSKLTVPYDEESHGSMMGGRARKGFPDEAGGSDSHEYDRQKEKDIPGAQDFEPPSDVAADRSYDISGEFADSTEAISRSNKANEDMKARQRGDDTSLENQLGKARLDNSITPRHSDKSSVFDRVSRKQRGIKR